jgi:hypothetical protein
MLGYETAFDFIELAMKLPTQVQNNIPRYELPTRVQNYIHGYETSYPGTKLRTLLGMNFLPGQNLL